MLAFTFGHVELLTVDYHSIDISIAELNNHTLREVFELGNLVVNGDFSNGLSGWSTYGGNTTHNISTVGDILVIQRTSVGENVSFAQPITLTVSNKMYSYFTIASSYDFATANINYIATVDNYPLYSLNGAFTKESIIQTVTSNDGLYILTNNLNIDNGEQINIMNVGVIDLTSLGISALTLEQMDAYFEMYQENISGNDVTYVANEMSITDLTYIIGFGFVWFVIIWSIKKVVL
jgi:hypothetical protein